VTQTAAPRQEGYKRAITIIENTVGPSHPDTAALLSNLGELYRNTGEYEKVEPLYQRAQLISELKLGREHPDTGRVLENLAASRWASGDLAAAQSLARRAHAIREKNLATFLLTGSESRMHSYLGQLRGATFMNITLSLASSNHQAKELGLNSLLMSKGRVLDAMVDNVERLRKSVKPQHRKLLEQLSAVAQRLSTLTYQKHDKLKPEVYHKLFQELTTNKEELEEELSTDAMFQQEIAPITITAVQEKLPANTALIEWFRYHPDDVKAKDQQSQWGKPRYVAYVLKLNGELAAEDAGDAETIEELIQDFRTGLADPKSTYVGEVGGELYSALIKPLERYLRNVDHLIIAPDGALNLVPFTSLLDETGVYLGTKREITYVTSGRDLLRLKATSVGKSDAVIVADPDYGKANTVVAKAEVSDQGTRSVDLDRGGIIFERLQGTAVEAKTLKSVLRVSDDKVFMQSTATEDRIRQLHGPHILHVATHGFFLKDNEIYTASLKRPGFSQDQATVPVGENPLLRSGLALAGANLRQSGEKDDGILTAAEVAQIDLRGTQLVVLSACETGLGDIQNGEGVYGLRRALVLAGAESQVTSLWKVADEATKDLMVDYYQRLLKGEGRSEALRNAQSTMMKSKDRSHPYYWAAFVPIGDWRPLAKSH
jgi:CHAT domain-containing protein